MGTSARATDAKSQGYIPFAEVRRLISGHVPCLDGIRGVAILLVLIHHLCWVSGDAPLGNTIFRVIDVGWTGVALFFVLSGFLITGILLDSKQAENYFSSFYARRALRILPLYYLSLAVFFVMFPLFRKLGLPHPHDDFYRGEHLWYWFYLGNWSHLGSTGGGPLDHFWSLAVEEQFYLVWPWVVFLNKRRGLVVVCAGLVVCSQICRGALHLCGMPHPEIYGLTVTEFDGLVMGALAALVARDKVWLERMVPRLKYLAWGGVGLFAAIGAARRSFSQWTITFLLGNLPLTVGFAAFLLWAILQGESGWLKFLKAPGLRSCGKYSYAMYVFHFPLAQFYYSRSLGPARFLQPLGGAGTILQAILQFTVLGGITYGLARLSWWAWENPFNELKSHFKARHKIHLVDKPGSSYLEDSASAA